MGTPMFDDLIVGNSHNNYHIFLEPEDCSYQVNLLTPDPTNHSIFFQPLPLLFIIAHQYPQQLLYEGVHSFKKYLFEIYWHLYP